MDHSMCASYPDSSNSSPRYREFDCENSSWEDHAPSNYKVKLMCSYGGRIQPRPHDNQLAYIGGDTKIVAVDRSVRFSSIASKLSALCDSEVCFKYQLPGEDLDALISVTNDEDVEHMMLEYDRIQRASARPARLRLFLFPLNPQAASSAFNPPETKADRQWFVDALNSTHIETATPPPGNPDFLFGFDKGYSQKSPEVQNPAPDLPATDASPVDTSVGSELAKGDAQIGIGESAISPRQVQRQIQDFRKLQVASQEHSSIVSKQSDGIAAQIAPPDYSLRPPEKTTAPPSNLPVPAAVPATYWPERPMPAGVLPAMSGSEQPVYLIPASPGLYPAVRSMSGQLGHGYYAVQRMIPPESYRESPAVYSAVVPPAVATKVSDVAYGQLAYDNPGSRQLFYTPATPGGVVSTTYQTGVAPVEARPAEVKVAKPAQAS